VIGFYVLYEIVIFGDFGVKNKWRFICRGSKKSLQSKCRENGWKFEGELLTLETMEA